MINGLLHSCKSCPLPRLVEQFGLEKGLAEFRRRVQTVLEAIALAGGHASGTYQEAVETTWNAYWRGEYERVANLARQGNAEAQYTLALYYGLGAPPDLTKVAEWLHKSAKQGHPQAQLILGYERYFRQDYAEAVKWYRLAAEQGDAVAQNQLGDIYYQGEGLAQDYAEAARWYRRAAQQGSGLSSQKAQLTLGFMYADGKGVSQDYIEAARWWNLAADQGVARAQFNLGVVYRSGWGVPKDHAEALKWFQKAADQGVAEAQYNLGYMYAGGEGVPQDDVQAYMWGSIAAASFPPGETRDRTAEALDKLAAHMTPEQITKAQRMARDWLERHGTGGQQ